MAPQFGRLTTQLVDTTIPPTDQYCDLINRRIAPKTAVSADSIYVGAMFLVSDQINSFGGRFPNDEHARLAELLIDSPVLVGHRKDTLPIARNFHAELVERSGEKWVKSYFYWLRGSQGAESLKTNIEGGLYKECSIAFTYNLPECSICGNDIRGCEHEPGASYQTSDGDSVCHFNYRQIDRVLEASLVYRGAVPNTLVTTDDHSTAQIPPHHSTQTLNQHGPSIQPIDSLDALDRDSRYLVVPRYDAIPVVLSLNNNRVAVSRFDSTPVDLNLSPVPSNRILPRSRAGLLIGLQGRRRCTRSEIETYLKDKSSPVTRLVIAAYPDTTAGAPPAKYSYSRDLLKTLSHRLVPWADLQSAVNAVATRDGVEIWPLGADPRIDSGYYYRGESRRITMGKSSSTLKFDETTATGSLTLVGQNQTIQFKVPNLTPAGFASGRRFLVNPVNDPRNQLAVARITSDIRKVECERSLSDGGEAGVRIVLRRAVLNGRCRWLVNKVSEASTGKGNHARS